MQDTPRSQSILRKRLPSPHRVLLTGVASLLAIATLVPVTGCRKKPAASAPAPATATMIAPEIGGQKAIYLRRTRTGDGTHPEFLSITLLPGRGMNTFQITAWLPGKGEVPLLASPTLDKAALLLNNGPGDETGNQSFTLGGALLFPFANRIRGQVAPDKKTIAVTWKDQTIHLLANWVGKLPGAQPHAMHGLMLNSRADGITTSTTQDGATATAVYHLPANGHWFSDNDATVTVTLNATTLDVSLHAVNTGKTPELIGVGWHPYFALPSGNRANARLNVPSDTRAQVDNYDNVFPTGKLLPVQNTPYDFRAPAGAPLPPVLVDESFIHLQRNPQGEAVCNLTDVAADYGMRVTAMTPLIRAFQVYSPVASSFVAIEPQFNYGDPLGKEWKEDSGMVTVDPGHDVTWKVGLELFQPSQQSASSTN